MALSEEEKKARKREYDRKYRAANSERERERGARYYAENRGRIIERALKHHVANRERKLEQMRTYGAKLYSDPEYREIERERGREYAATPDGRAGRLLRAAERRAKKKSLPFNLYDYKQRIADILRDGACHYSGLPFNMHGGLTWDSPSLDQVEAGAGYTWDNTRVVLNCLNAAKGTSTLENLVFVAQKLVDHQALKVGNTGLLNRTEGDET